MLERTSGVGPRVPLFTSAAAIQHEVMHTPEKCSMHENTHANTHKKWKQNGEMTCVYSLILMVKTSPVLDLNT